MYADILIKNGKCMTMKKKEIREWVAIKQGGRIIAIGDGGEYEHLVSKDTIVFDAQGILYSLDL